MLYISTVFFHFYSNVFHTNPTTNMIYE